MCNLHMAASHLLLCPFWAGCISRGYNHSAPYSKDFGAQPSFSPPQLEHHRIADGSSGSSHAFSARGWATKSRKRKPESSPQAPILNI